MLIIFFFSVSSTAEERQPYIQQSQVDKKRYEKESAEYRAAAAPAPVDVDSD
jgi:structure-specific recognition protein 1